MLEDPHSWFSDKAGGNRDNPASKKDSNLEGNKYQERWRFEAGG